MDIETYFFQDKIIVEVYNAYIDGLSSQDIAFKMNLFHDVSLDENQINNIIDLINQIL